MRKLFISSLVLFSLLLVGAGCKETTKGQDSNQNQNNLPEEELVMTGDSYKAKELVKEYIKFTLGSVNGAEIDYEAAKDLLIPELANEFTSPAFIPASFCIQDGPSDVRASMSIFNEEMNWFNVVIEGKYGEEWSKMWNFQVVPVEGDEFMINKIRCLNE